jgi:hypothetical protein
MQVPWPSLPQWQAQKEQVWSYWSDELINTSVEYRGLDTARMSRLIQSARAKYQCEYGSNRESPR